MFRKNGAKLIKTKAQLNLLKNFDGYFFLFTQNQNV